MQFLSLFTDEVWTQWVLALAGGLIFYVVLTALRKSLSRRLNAWSESMKVFWLDPLLRAVELPFRVGVSLIAVIIAFQIAPLEGRPEFVVTSISRVLIVILGFWFIDRALSVFLPGLRGDDATSSPSARSMVSTLIRLAILSVLLLVVLDTMGVAITPILASLGVGSIAVGLALQDTLSNFFSGIYLLVDKPISEGNFVKIGDSIEGHVKSIGWRSTHVLLQSNNTVVIPNSKLASSPITNFHLPESECNVVVHAGVDLDSDLEKVERVTLEVAKEVLLRVKGAVPHFDPVVRYTEFGEFRVNFNITLRAEYYPDHNLVKHEFIKALHSRYRKERISIALPQRVIQTSSLSIPSLLNQDPGTLNLTDAKE